MNRHIRFLVRALAAPARFWQQWLGRIEFRGHEDKILLLLSLVISATVGLIVVSFVVVTERLGSKLIAAGATQRMLSPVLGSLVTGWLLFRFFPDARGSGIPQTRVAMALGRGFIGLRTVAGKFLCSAISLASGIALGREGPSVQIGAGVASVAGRRLGLGEDYVRSLIPVGTAAALAAAFNTPLAAVLFSLEEILADLHARVVGSVVIGAATSWIVLRLILGDEPLFHVPAYQLVHPIEFPFYALLGLLGGLVSTAFVKLLLWQRDRYLKAPQRWRPLAPAVGGLTVGLLALAVPGVLGAGYTLVGDALNGQLALRTMLLLLCVKLIATTSCYASGNAGGIFGPSLFIGAMLGGAVGNVIHALIPDYTGNAGAYALVGMGAAFAGIIRTPMTSVIMIFEVTRDYTIIVPLMIANLCSYFLAQKLQKLPIYEALCRQEGVVLPSAAHRPEPLTVERAMRPLGPSSGYVATGPEVPCVYPDDPLDLALQRMGQAGIEEIPVLSRAGGRQIGLLNAQDVLRAYFAPLRADAPEKVAAAPSQHWLPAVATIATAAVLISSGLTFWQRFRRSDLGKRAYEHGTTLLAQGRVDEAVLAFRSGLAHNPQDTRLRTALGLALVESGHFGEASSYLSEAARSDPSSGAVWMGLARIALAGGQKQKALELLRRALSRDWTAEQKALRTRTEFDYAGLLADMGRSGEAVSVLVAMIEEHADDPLVAKKAAEAVNAIGSPEQAETAYGMLASRFPADAGVWLRLGDARFAAGKERLALEAYRRAAKADPQNEQAQRAAARAEEAVRLDPTQRGLSVRERARRWDEVLRRVIAAAAACGPSEEIAKARRLLNTTAFTIEASDRKMQVAQAIWEGTGAACKQDEVLNHIMAKLNQ
ncbi:MAG TPA: chloride channel protein [Bryobacteraceae bacterium]|nr:chloride channel protein [Bryobacteraceae bacterium]